MLRYGKLDSWRGFWLVNMIVYHAVWDLLSFGTPQRLDLLFSAPLVIWQQAICWSFIWLSGFVVGIGKRPLRRAITILLAGALVTLTTLWVWSEMAIWFGILTCIGSCMLLTSWLLPLLRRVPAQAGWWLSALFFALTFQVADGILGNAFLFSITLPEHWYSGMIATYFGLPDPQFQSLDYFPLFPWIFLFWNGYFSFRHGAVKGQLSKLVTTNFPILALLGRHTLPIYLLHQPILYLLFVIFLSK